MPPESDALLDRARSATGDELKSFLHETNEELLLALLENPHLKETHVTLLLERLDLSAKVLSAIAGAGSWNSSEAVRMRLARHPRTPKRISLAVVRQLYLFDLVRLSLLPSAPADVRRMAEAIIVSRIPQLRAGEKLTLAHRGPARVVGALLAEGHPQVVKPALANAFLTESQVLKVLAKPDAPERVVAAIAQHPKWSCQYNVRIALVCNAHTPVPSVMAFLPQLALRDLREICALDGLAPHLRNYVQRELAVRAGAAREPAC